MKEALAAQCIEAALSSRAAARCTGKIEIFQTIDSTNSEAKRRLDVFCNSDNLHGAVLIAEHQSAGRGRMGRSFYSPAQSGIYLSIVYSPEHEKKQTNLYATESRIEDFDVLTAFTAVAVCRALDCFGISAEIKWVNDIFVNGKKVCGILTEGVLDTGGKNVKNIIVGIGINVYESQNGFPPELKNTAAALHSGIPAPYIDRNILAAKLISGVFDVFSGTIPSAVLMEEYKKRSLVLGKKVYVVSSEGMYEAEVLEITNKAHLIVENTAGNREELLSGEIRICLPRV